MSPQQMAPYMAGGFMGGAMMGAMMPGAQGQYGTPAHPHHPAHNPHHHHPGAAGMPPQEAALQRGEPSRPVSDVRCLCLTGWCLTSGVRV